MIDLAVREQRVHRRRCLLQNVGQLGGAHKLVHNRWEELVWLGMRSPPDASLTSVLVTRRLAEAAAQTASGTLFDGSLNTDEEAFYDQLDTLHWHLYGVRADEEWSADITALWLALSAEGPEPAWIVVVATMLQDPLFLVGGPGQACWRP